MYSGSANSSVAHHCTLVHDGHQPTERSQRQAWCRSRASVADEDTSRTDWPVRRATRIAASDRLSHEEDRRRRSSLPTKSRIARSPVRASDSTMTSSRRHPRRRRNDDARVICEGAVPRNFARELAHLGGSDQRHPAAHCWPAQRRSQPGSGRLRPSTQRSVRQRDGQCGRDQRQHESRMRHRARSQVSADARRRVAIARSQSLDRRETQESRP